MLPCLCNSCHLFCCSQVTPNIAWCPVMAFLLDLMFTNKIIFPETALLVAIITIYKKIMFTNKIDRFTNCDRDILIGFRSELDLIQAPIL